MSLPFVDDLDVHLVKAFTANGYFWHHHLHQEVVMELLARHGIDRVFHFAPLHYLSFIGLSRELKSKPVLTAESYSTRHFRSTSAHIDTARGFGNSIHLSSVPEPPILTAKLGAGFPHIGIELITSDLPDISYDLCRFNIAKTRQLRRHGKLGFPENEANGRYYGDLQIPIARTSLEKEQMLNARSGYSMIEVLVEKRLHLPGSVRIRAYCKDDQGIAQRVLANFGVDWPVLLVDTSTKYVRNKTFGASVDQFIETALADRTWRGNGLEFDRV